MSKYMLTAQERLEAIKIWALQKGAQYKALDHGYTLTVHKSQGMTAQNTRVLIDSSYWDRNLSFVAMTRYKQSLKLYADTLNHPTLDKLKKKLSRRTAKTNVIDCPLNFAVRCGLNPDKALGQTLNKVAPAHYKNAHSEIEKIRAKYPIVAEFETLLKKRQKESGYFAERIDKKINIMAQAILKNTKIMQHIKRQHPAFVTKIDKQLAQEVERGISR